MIQVEKKDSIRIRNKFFVEVEKVDSVRRVSEKNQLGRKFFNQVVKFYFIRQKDFEIQSRNILFGQTENYCLSRKTRLDQTLNTIFFQVEKVDLVRRRKCSPK